MSLPELEINKIRSSKSLLLNELRTLLKAIEDGNYCISDGVEAVERIRARYIHKFKLGLYIALHSGRKEELFPAAEDHDEIQLMGELANKLHERHRTMLTKESKNSEALRNSNSCTNNPTSRTVFSEFNLPRFSGNVQEWPKFKQSFLSNVHNNEDMWILHKYIFLTSALLGEALAVITPFMENRNYEMAWETLTKRYDRLTNKKSLATAYIENIVDFHEKNEDGTAHPALQSYIRVVEENIAAFRALSVPNEVDFLLLTLALRNLSAMVRRDFQVDVQSTEWPTTTYLVDFLKRYRKDHVSKSN